MSDRRAWPVVLLMAFAIAVLLVGTSAWRSYSRSPQYSLSRLALALHAGDWAAFSRFVDIDAVSEDIAERVIDQRLGETGLDLGLGSLSEPLTEAAKPIVARQVEQRLRRSVEARFGNTGLREQIGAMWYTRSPRRLQVSGDEASVTVALDIDRQVRELDLRMERRGDRWVVIEVENVEELLGSSP